MVIVAKILFGSLQSIELKDFILIIICMYYKFLFGLQDLVNKSMESQYRAESKMDSQGPVVECKIE